MYDVKYIPINLKYLRKYILKQSQELFSEKVGLSKDTISNIERNEFYPSIQTLTSIANATNQSIDFFLTVRGA